MSAYLLYICKYSTTRAEIGFLKNCKNTVKNLHVDICCWCCGCALPCKAVLINTGVFAAGDVLDLHVAYIRAK